MKNNTYIIIIIHILSSLLHQQQLKQNLNKKNQKIVTVLSNNIHSAGQSAILHVDLTTMPK